MNKTLTVKYSRTRLGEPLAVVDGLPGGFAELRPAELRALAAALMRTADACECHKLSPSALRNTFPLSSPNAARA